MDSSGSSDKKASPSEETDLEAKPSFRRVLSNRPFSLLWLGELVSQSGDYLFEVALVWLVLVTTGSVVNVGLIISASLLPSVFVGPIAGVYIDKFNRKSILIASNLFQAGVVSLIALLYSSNSLNFALLLLLVFLLNSGAQFVKPSVNAVIPNLVERSDLISANSLVSISSSTNSLIGFALGGVLILLFGPTFSIYYDGFSFVFAAATISLIARSYCEIPRISASSSLASADATQSFFHSFNEGLKFIGSNRVLVELVVFATIINFFGAGITSLITPYAKLVVHGNSVTYGLLLAGFSLGSIIGFLVVGKLNARRYLGRLLFAGVLTTGALMAIMGAVSWAPIAILLAVAVGLVLAVVNLPINVLIQVKVPGSLLGRVGTSLAALATISQPIAAAISGGIGNSISVGSTFELFGIAMILMTVGLSFAFVELRSAKY